MKLFLMLALLLPILLAVTATVDIPLVGGGNGGGSGDSVVKLLAEDPADGEFFPNLMHFVAAHTASRIHCQCQGGGDIIAIWTNDSAFVRDGTPGEIVCDAEEDDDSLSGDVTFAAGSDANLLLGTKNGTVDSCQFFMYVTED